MNQLTAFPVTDQGGLIQDGLTKREYIAAMCLQGILASGSGGDKHVKIDAAIEYADVLLSELEEDAK